MIIEGMLLGLAYVLPPGPVTTETVRRSLCGGTPAASKCSEIVEGDHYE